ncbi:MAG: hypothetical protein JSS32_01455 [Verrucomicrobia bacterium]|nr:hypothetical protein [Verrucomicrobiota bacterium]
MKAAFSLLLLFALPLFSAPVGNPYAPKIIEEGFFIPKDCWVDARAGYEGDFVADAKLKQYGQGQGRVDSYQQETNSGTATLNILERVDVFGILGSSRTNADWRFEDSSGAVHRIELETNYDFLWGVGIRGLLVDWNSLGVGVGGRYEESKFNPSWLTSDGVPQSVGGSLLKWREWQIDLDFSYKIDIFIPYVGVKYSNVQTKISGFSIPISQSGTGNNQFKNRIPVGVFIGCSLSSSKYFMLNIEGRLVDEEAVTVSGDIRF